jgi:hypothetical protein
VELPKSVLFNAWEYAVGQYNGTIKKPHEDNNIFMANLWVNGIFQALKKEGYEVSICKDGKEIWSLKPS